jgi:peptidoglycan/LPS O-acetylase OafA/YrhL
MSDLAPSPITIFNIPKRTASLFRPDIEGLRGLAVLLVVLYHVGVPMFGGGFIGVDVFFVLSGYLITGLIVREIETSGRLDLLHFYARRARRLLPASALMLLIISAATAILLSPPEQVNLARSARATAAYLSNLWFTGEASNYFAPGIETNPLLHTWSLAVEEQFYAFWPLLVLFGLRVAALVGGWP